MNIFISNLSFDIKDEDLREFFMPYGEVITVTVIKDKMTGRSRGFGFVEMTDATAAQKAIAELNNSTVDGRPINVVEARPQEKKPARDFSPFRPNKGAKRNRW